MAEIRTGLRVDMTGNIVSQAKRYTAEVNKFTNSGRGGLKAMGTQANWAAGEIGKFGSKTLKSASQVDILSDEIIKLESGLVGVDEKLNLTTASLGKFDARAGSVDTSTARIGRNMSALGVRMSRLASGAGIAATLMASAFAATDVHLEDAMLGLKSNLMSTYKDADELNNKLQNIRDSAKEISQISATPLVENINGLNQLLKAGVNPSIVGGKSGAGMASAGLSKLAEIPQSESAKFLADYGSAFGFKSSQDYMNFADRVVKADDASAMDTKDIIYNASQGIGTALRLKIDPKKWIDMTAYLSPLKNEAGTALNRMFERMAAVNPHERKAFQKLGLNFWEKDKKNPKKVSFVGPDRAIAMIVKSFQGMSNEQVKMQMAQLGFAEEGGKAVAIFAEAKRSFTDFTSGVDSGASLMEKLAIRTSGLSGALERLETSVIDLTDRSFEPLRKSLTKLVNWVNDVIQPTVSEKDPEFVGPRQKHYGRGHSSGDTNLDWLFAPSPNTRGFHKQSLQDGDSSVNGKVRLEIVSQVPVRVRGIQTTTGDIEVNHKRTGPHFS